MALERGKLGDQLFFDVQKKSHRFLSALINSFLKLPPLKQLLVADNLKSRLMANLAQTVIKDFEKSVMKEKLRLRIYVK